MCARVGGANTTPLFSEAHFAKRNTKFGGGGKARAGKKEGGWGKKSFSGFATFEIFSLPKAILIFF